MTYYWLLGLCIVVGAAGGWLRRRNPGWGQVLIGAGCLGIVGLLGWQVSSFARGGRSRAVDRYQAAVAYRMGYEVLAELRGYEGTIGLLLPPDTRANQAALDTLFNTFARVLAPLPALQIKDAPLATRSRSVLEGRVPLAAFDAALAELPDCLAYVSFAGVPADIARSALWQRARSTPLFVFDPSGGTNWLALLEQGRIRRVIVPRSDTADEGRGQAIVGPPHELFERFFLAIGPSDVAAGKAVP